MQKTISPGSREPFWYKDAIIYELHVRSFADSNGDGIGDFKGLTQKLDYLADLGVTALWLLPFYPSPLKDDGYDTADYVSINPSYGTLADFDEFIAEAHKRHLRVITELVINHTSDQHGWFQRARRSPKGSVHRDYYVWTDDVQKYKEARIIFKDFEPSNWTWDPLAQAFYWHRFFGHQPDLNFDNPVVHEEIFKIVDFWLGKGVDGFRLDAIPYLYEREGTSCESLPETHAYLKKLRRYVDDRYGDRMLLAEANQWPEESVTYFGGGKGDECHAAFHFPLMPRLFMSVQMEDRIPVVDIMEQTPPLPETSQWALFLRNHDELTLEMVTDEERDYMWRVYATQPKAKINLGIRHRLAPLLGNNRSKIELLNMLLFSMPGTPVIYYGDEIGMGDNVYLGDRNGVRTPMHWNSDKNAGFSRANPQALPLPVILDPEYHYEANNVEAQQANPNSLLWWMKRLISLRKQVKAFGQGTIEFLHPENRKILAYTRKHDGETLLVVANLSRFPQAVHLDLSPFEGCVPMEMFGRTKFPPITNTPYVLTLGSHSAFWFRLQAKTSPEFVSDKPPKQTFRVRHHLSEVFGIPGRRQLESSLSAYLQQRHWFLSRNRDVCGTRLLDLIPIDVEHSIQLCFITLEYTTGEPETYVVPVSVAGGEAAKRLENGSPQWVIASVENADKHPLGIIYDAIGNETLHLKLINALADNAQFRGLHGELRCSSGEALQALRGHPALSASASLSNSDSNNSGIVFKDHFFLKFFRRLEPGINPDVEAMEFLQAKNFPHVPKLAGALEYKHANGRTMSLGMLTVLLPEAQTGWDYTVEELGRYFEQVQAETAERISARALPIIEMLNKGMPDGGETEVGAYLQSAQLLGQRVAELHTYLSSDRDNPEFAPEPFTPFYQRSLFQSMRNLTLQNLELLGKKLPTLSPEVQELGRKVLDSKETILARLRSIYRAPFEAHRIRCHGDLHLRQALYTGKDFYFIDFEGEPTRALTERKIKRSPIADISGMLRSFDYAVQAALRRQSDRGSVSGDEMSKLQPRGLHWRTSVSTAFLNAYFSTIRPTNLLPGSREAIAILLNVGLLEKAIYELGYELSNRPGWIDIPMHGILEILDLWTTP